MVFYSFLFIFVTFALFVAFKKKEKTDKYLELVNLSGFLFFLVWGVSFLLIPEKFPFSKDVSARYQEDVSYVKDKLSFIGMNCSEVNVTFLSSPLSPTYNEVELHAFGKDVTIINLEGSQKDLRVYLFKYIGESCQLPKDKAYLAYGFNKFDFNQEELLKVKEHGLQFICNEKFGIKLCSMSPVKQEKNQYYSFKKVVSYNDLKSDLSRIIDVEDTYEVLENNPLEFQKNFVAYFSNNNK